MEHIKVVAMGEKLKEYMALGYDIIVDDTTVTVKDADGNTVDTFENGS